ncbi:hypothetical protein GY45DRAFT_443925 [Cubamyces sp. BRFM 1775]|nr:hypothetical protein GY45DRAFT_443925 [Cubamyces sp. BRFM 1775]
MLDVGVIMKVGRRRRIWVSSRKRIADAGDREAEGERENHDEQEEDTKAERGGGDERSGARRGKAWSVGRCSRTTAPSSSLQTKHASAAHNQPCLPPRPTPAAPGGFGRQPTGCDRRARTGRRARRRGARDGSRRSGRREWEARAGAEAFLPKGAGGRELMGERASSHGEVNRDLRRERKARLGRAREGEERNDGLDGPIASQTRAVGC